MGLSWSDDYSGYLEVAQEFADEEGLDYGQHEF